MFKGFGGRKAYLVGINILTLNLLTYFNRIYISGERLNHIPYLPLTVWLLIGGG
jgi:hypothetical protein